MKTPLTLLKALMTILTHGSEIAAFPNVLPIDIATRPTFMKETLSRSQNSFINPVISVKAWPWSSEGWLWSSDTWDADPKGTAAKNNSAVNMIDM
jgi:hypothetical protein